MIVACFTNIGSMSRVVGIGVLTFVLTLTSQGNARNDSNVPIESVLSLCEAENDVIRAFWTKEIVGPGIKVGLKFSGDWRETDIEAGPLPALFLQATAENLAKTPFRLGLRLGSDFPIRAESRIEGAELAAFQQIKKSGQPEFFRAQASGLYTAMFPDFAVADPCVSCHNAHKDSPKRDWRLNDVMGATIWTFPSDDVTADELAAILIALRGAIKDAYAAYIEKAANFSEPPKIGEKWPRDGYYLPSVDVFMQNVGRLIPTLDSLALDN